MRPELALFCTGATMHGRSSNWVWLMFNVSPPTTQRLQQPIINATFYLNIIELNSKWLIWKALYTQIKHLYM